MKSRLLIMMSVVILLLPVALSAGQLNATRPAAR